MGVGTAVGLVVAPAAVISSLWVVVVIFHLAVSVTVVVVAGGPVLGGMDVGAGLSYSGQWRGGCWRRPVVSRYGLGAGCGF